MPNAFVVYGLLGTPRLERVRVVLGALGGERPARRRPSRVAQAQRAGAETRGHARHHGEQLQCWRRGRHGPSQRARRPAGLTGDPSPTRRDDIAAPVTPCRHRLQGAVRGATIRTARCLPHRACGCVPWRAGCGRGTGLARNLHYSRLASAPAEQAATRCATFHSRWPHCSCHTGA